MILVCGAGGFLGGHLVEALRKGEQRVRAVDIKPLSEWYQLLPDVENYVLDLQDISACRVAVRHVSRVYNLAADMGGIGYISAQHASCALSVLINTHMLLAARDAEVERFFFSSSACVYAADKQADPGVSGLKESDAYPAMPEPAYGEEKLFSERMCQYFTEDFGLQTRVARFHNCYGPLGTFEGGREKAPAAICRKIAAAVLTGIHEIEIWGDGTQTRSFMFVDDCIEGTRRLMASDVTEPLNIGSSEKVTINELVDIVESIAGTTVKRTYNLDAPKGVNGRNSDNTLIRERLGWEPSIPLRVGMEMTYRWIYDQLRART